MAHAFPHLHVVLLCDTYGARLWPIAREDAPACLAPVQAGSETSLLAATVERVRSLSEFPLHIVTTERLAGLMEDELLSVPELAECDVDMLVMPTERGSAFAIALAAAHIRRSDPAAVVAVFPSNQQVEFDDRWQRLMYRAYLAALRDKLVVVGGQQEGKCADNTFMRRGRVFEGMEDTYELRVFNAQTPAIVAQRARREGALWYTGVLFGRAARILGEFARAGREGRSDESRSAGRIAETAGFFAELAPGDILKPEARDVVGAVPNVSFDKAVLEATGNAVVVPTTIEFATVSSLADLERTLEADSARNRAQGAVKVLNSKNVTVLASSPGRKVAVLGLRDVMLVDTGDVLLVAGKEHLGELDDALLALRDESGE